MHVPLAISETAFAGVDETCITMYIYNFTQWRPPKAHVLSATPKTRS